MHENPNQELYKLRILKPPRCFDWALRIGEIVHNARSPLDHLVYALVMSNNGTPDKKTAFPIFDSRWLFHEANGKAKRPSERSGLRKLHGIDGNAQTLIESFQPYPRRSDVNDRLLLLHRLWEIDKHRLPLLGAGATVLNDFSAYAWGEFSPLVLGGPAEFKDGAVFGVQILKPGMTGNVNVQLDLSVQIRFRESGPWGERPIATVLAEGIDSSRRSSGSWPHT